MAARDHAAGGKAVFCPACGHPVPIPTHAQRIRAGMRRARHRGIRLGRPPAPIDRQAVQQLRGQGLSLAAIAARVGIAKSTVAKIVHDAR